MSLATALHRALAELRDAHGYSDAYWEGVAGTLIDAYATALEDERQADAAA